MTRPALPALRRIIDAAFIRAQSDLQPPSSSYRQRSSVRSLPLKRSRPSAVVKRSIERISLHHTIDPRPIHASTKHQNDTRLCLHHKMLHIDCAFHAARLVRSLEMTGNHSSLLLQLKIFCRSRSVGIFAVQSPVAGSICGLLLCRRLLSPHESGIHRHQDETNQSEPANQRFQFVLQCTPPVSEKTLLQASALSCNCHAVESSSIRRSRSTRQGYSRP
jgi:hypothetical protein